MLNFLFGSKNQEPAKVVYVSAERGANETNKMCIRVMEAVGRKNHFVQWATGKTGWLGPDQLFKDALNTGRSEIQHYNNGLIWPTDAELVEEFRRVARIAGFNVTFRIIKSDGPEADTFCLEVTPMNNS